MALRIAAAMGQQRRLQNATLRKKHRPLFARAISIYDEPSDRSRRSRMDLPMLTIETSLVVIALGRCRRRDFAF